ncbi:MAG: ABC transporter ATP-binding protein [Dehalococcoidia bacterium]
MSEKPPAVEVIDLVKTFDEGRTRAVDGVTFSVAQGEFVAVTGPSGCGKSTLLHLIAALERPDSSGRIVVLGQDITRRRDLSRYRARTIGLVFQLHNLLPNLTAVENVEVPMYEIGLGMRERRRRALQLLGIVGLAEKARRRPPELSGGERQRVAIARSLSNDPPILLADEPTGNLDSKAGRNVIEALQAIHHERGLTIIMVTHDPGIAASADRVIRMLDGRIEAS